MNILSDLYANKLRKIAKKIKNSNNLWNSLNPLNPLNPESVCQVYINCNNATRLKKILKSSRDTTQASKTINESKIKVIQFINKGIMNVDEDLDSFKIVDKINNIISPDKFSLVGNLCIKTETEYNSCKTQFENEYTYTINFMWLNRTKDDIQRYVFPTNSEDSIEIQRDELFTKYLNNIIEWSTKHSRINIYYDGSTTSKTSVDNTKKEISNILNIKFIDCLEIPYIKMIHKELNDISIYFKTDLYRIMVGLFDIEVHPDNYYHVFANLNMPIQETELFDEETLKTLSFHGTVLSCNLSESNCGTLGYENSFFIMANIKDTNIVDSYYFFIYILITILKLEITDWIDKRKTLPELNINDLNNRLDQLVYDLYPILFIDNYIKRELITYAKDSKKDITDVLNIDKIKGKKLSRYINSNNIIVFDCSEKVVINDIIKHDHNWNYLGIKIPTKKIKQPLASRKYSMSKFIGNLPASLQSTVDD